MWRLMAAYRQLASDNSSAPHENTPKAAGGAPGSRQPRLNAAIFQGFASLVWQPQGLQTAHRDYSCGNSAVPTANMVAGKSCATVAVTPTRLQSAVAVHRWSYSVRRAAVCRSACAAGGEHDDSLQGGRCVALPSSSASLGRRRPAARPTMPAVERSPPPTHLPGSPRRSSGWRHARRQQR